jgi:hypothetical protein
MKQELPEESPILWTTQAFGVAAAVSTPREYVLYISQCLIPGQIILSLDNFNRHQSAREYEEHRKLIFDVISILSSSISISSIAARGTRLLTELMAEEKSPDRGNSKSAHSQTGLQKSRNSNSNQNDLEKSLNVAAFVKKFCESDQLPPVNSSITTLHMPLWLQQENSFQPYSESHRLVEGGYSSDQRTESYSTFRPRAHRQAPPFDDSQSKAYQLHSTQKRYPDIALDSFAQAFSDSFDVRSVNWFDDLLGLAPSNSI